MDPGCAEQIRQIVGLATTRRVPEALARARLLVAEHPGEAEAWRLLAQLAGSQGAIDDAIGAYRRAAALRPSDLDMKFELARTALAGQRRRAALEAAHAIAAANPAQPAQLDALGTIFTICEEAQAALPLFEAASAAAPGNSGYLYNLAAAQRMNGQMEAAEANLDQVIAAGPTESMAWLMRADIRRQTPARNHVADLERALARPGLQPASEIVLCYALAKELEDLGDHARAFSYLSRGAATQRAQIAYNVEDDIALLERIRARHNKTTLGLGVGHPNSEPIFVIGLPRSGTTLVERILGSHPAVSNIGEAHAFGVALQRALRPRLGRAPTKRDIVDLGPDLDAEALGRAYIEETRPQTGKTPRFVDKMLTNYLHAGLIARALPSARIVVLRRAPMDACYAMYKALLTGEYSFTSSLREIALYYVAWSKLIDHWAATLGDAFHVVSYEQLVTEPEPNIRALIEFVGLPWDDKCLSFHLSPQAVTTASAAQVREPVYTSSVGKWRAYRNELQDVAVLLTAHGLDPT